MDGGFSVVGEGIPNWIAAVATAGALVAAWRAAVYAKRAAEYTRKEAHEAHEQTKIALGELEASKQSARRVEESRYDERIPSIRARLHAVERGSGAVVTWRPVASGGHATGMLREVLPHREGHRQPLGRWIRVEVNYEFVFTNISQRPGWIRLGDATLDSNGDWSLRFDRSLYIAPGEDLRIGYQFVVMTDRRGYISIDGQDFTAIFCVHDAAREVCDRYVFTGRIHSPLVRDGDELVIVGNVDPTGWPDIYAVPDGTRLYHRLDDDFVSEPDCANRRR